MFETDERAEFLASADPTRLLYAVTHLPAEPARSGVVVVSPLFLESMQNYNREASVGRELAAAGYAVRRFHPRGGGDSDGDLADLLHDTLVEDAVAMAVSLSTETGVAVDTVVGTRLAAPVAAAVARRLTAARLVLWEPIEDPANMIKAMGRSRQMAAIAGLIGPEDRPLSEMLAADRKADVLGFMIPAGYLESLGGRTVATELGGHRVRGLVIAGGTGREGRWATAVAAGMSEAGHPTEVQTLATPESWWLLAADDPLGRRERTELGNAVVAATVGWLAGGSLP